MDNQPLVLCGGNWLHRVHCRSPRSLAVGFEGIQNFDDGIAVFGKGLVGHLHFHLGAVFLQAELGMLLKPPRSDLSLAYSAKNWQWWWMVARVRGTLFS
jgi:hypothetical protein